MEASPVSFQRVPLPLRVRVAEELAGLAPMALRQGESVLRTAPPLRVAFSSLPG